MRMELQVKARLADFLCQIIREWSGRQAAARLGVSPPQISELRRRRLHRISIERLINLIAMLGYDLEIVIKPRPRPTIIRAQPTATVSSPGFSG